MFFSAKKLLTATLMVVTVTTLVCSSSLTAYAAVSFDALTTAREDRLLLPIQSNETENWPKGPSIGAHSAVLMDAETGVILYSKNMNDQKFPASTTKLLTCLVLAENAKLDEMVTFSREAVSIPRGSSNMGMDAGQSITMEECLYGILVGSANEVSNAAAEHVGGSIEGFAQMMNEKAKSLGCENTYFTNANGLHEDTHYTSAYDLALIAKAFYKNELLSKISGTPTHLFEATKTQPDEFTLRTHHKLVNNEYKYEGIIGGKTGYTDLARQTLVTCAEKNGLKLICVIMQEESPNQFTDTQELFDYGFNNFEMVNVKENDSKYNIDHSDFFQSNNDIFGSSKPILSLNENSYLVLPKTALFEDVESSISYDVLEEQIAKIEYSYNGTFVGSATIDTAVAPVSSYDFESVSISEKEIIPETQSENILFVNVKKVLITILIIAGTFILILVIRSIILSYSFARKRKNRLRWRRRRRERMDRMERQYRDKDY